MPRLKRPNAFSTKVTPRKTPAVVFEKIYDWLYKMSCENDLERAKDKPQYYDVINRLQNICTYSRASDSRETRVAATDNYIYVTIKVNGNYKFEGFVLSLDEFKLIWDRVL